jgi:hypothetical protein
MCLHYSWVALSHDLQIFVMLRPLSGVLVSPEGELAIHKRGEQTPKEALPDIDLFPELFLLECPNDH